jgi:spore coat polysaccharide biosynthesis protein SpsF
MVASSTTAVVNVRMGSARLPGKALRVICGKPLMRHVIDRLALAASVDQVVVATSTLPVNDAIASYCAEQGISCFRGSEGDVLMRTLNALQHAGASTGLIAYGDGPLIDPRIVDQAVTCYMAADPPVDFVGNDLKTTFPPGMEVEVFSVSALADASQRCSDPEIREHGTLYLRLNPQRYRLVNFEAAAAVRRPDFELEVDVEDDLEVVARILNYFDGRLDFSLSEIVAYLDAHPEISSRNCAIPRRWKRFRSGP